MGQFRALFSGQVGFIPLGYLLCTLAGDDKTTARAGAAFLEGRGSCFTRPACLPQSSAKATVERDLLEVIPVLMGVEIPLALLSAPFSISAASKGQTSTDCAKALPCKYQSRDQGCNNRLHLLLGQATCASHV